jgi:autotransporter-associated beta strand protein
VSGSRQKSNASWAINFYSNDLKTLTINGGSGNNTYTIDGTPVLNSETLNAGSGFDTVNVHSTSAALNISESGYFGTVNFGDASNRLDSIQGAVTLGGGFPFVNVYDQGTSGSKTYTITGTGFSRSGIASITTGLLNSFSLQSNNAGNTFNVQANPAHGAPGLNLTPGSGVNSITLGSLSNSLDGIYNVSVLGATGTNTIVLNDQGVSAPMEYFISAPFLSTNSVARVRPGNYSDLTDLILTGGTYAYLTFDHASLVRVNGGTGSDVYSIGAGTAVAGSTPRAGVPYFLPNTSSARVTVNAGGTLDLNNSQAHVGSLAGAGNVTLGSGTLFEGADNSSSVFSGTISGFGGVRKEGSDTFTLSGFNTFYSGTHVTGGTLQVTGVLGDVNLDAGTTLAGTGDIGAVTGAGTVSPGTATATGQLATFADLTLDHATVKSAWSCCRGSTPSPPAAAPRSTSTSSPTARSAWRTR